MKKLTKSFQSTEFYIFLLIVIFGCVVQALSGKFFTVNTAISLSRSIAVFLIYAVCELLSLICVGPDVSFPAIGSFSGFVTAAYFKSINYDGPMIWILLATGFIGIFFGLINGLILANFKFPSLIVTLGTSTIIYGILNGPIKASTVANLCPTMFDFGHATLFTYTNPNTGQSASMPSTILVTLAVYLLAFLVLRYTMVGRSLYAIGGNETAAEYSGINIKAIKIGVFVVIGFLAGMGGALLTATNYVWNLTDLYGREMNIIAACILGGVRPGKGEGGLLSILLGLLLLTMVENNLMLMGIPLYYQKAFTGFVMIFGMILSMTDLFKFKKA